MTARFVWRRHTGVRLIEERAARTPDPVERLRYVRNQMDSREVRERPGWRLAKGIGIALATLAAILAVLLVRRILSENSK